MASRGLVIFHGKESGQKRVVSVYTRWDSYPSHQLETLADTLEFCNKGGKTTIEQVARMFCEFDFMHEPTIAINTLFEENDFLLANKVLCPSVLEWVYYVALTAKTVEVYGGRYINALPITHIRDGLLNVNKLIKHPDFVRIVEAGFTVNRKP